MLLMEYFQDCCRQQSETTHQHIKHMFSTQIQTFLGGFDWGNQIPKLIASYSFSYVIDIFVRPWTSLQLFYNNDLFKFWRTRVMPAIRVLVKASRQHGSHKGNILRLSHLWNLSFSTLLCFSYWAVLVDDISTKPKTYKLSYICPKTYVLLSCLLPILTRVHKQLHLPD